MTKQTSEACLKKTEYRVSGLILRNECLVMFQHVKNRSQELLADMTESNIEVLPFGAFLCQVIRKGFVSHSYEAGSLKHSSSEICGATFDHCGV